MRRLRHAVHYSADDDDVENVKIEPNAEEVERIMQTSEEEREGDEEFPLASVVAGFGTADGIVKPVLLSHSPHCRLYVLPEPLAAALFGAESSEPMVLKVISLPISANEDPDVAFSDAKAMCRILDMHANVLGEAARGSCLQVPESFRVAKVAAIVSVSSFVECSSLADYAAFDDNMSEGNVKYFVGILASEIAKLHSLGLVHGNLKTTNILFDSHRRALTLIDGGIVSDAEDAADVGAVLLRLALISSSFSSLPCRVFGSFCVASDAVSKFGGMGDVMPQVEKKFMWLPEDDIFAIGAACFELVAGFPFRMGLSIFDLCDSASSNPPSFIEKTNGQVFVSQWMAARSDACHFSLQFLVQAQAFVECCMRGASTNLLVHAFLQGSVEPPSMQFLPLAFIQGTLHPAPNFLLCRNAQFSRRHVAIDESSPVTLDELPNGVECQFYVTSRKDESGNDERNCTMVLSHNSADSVNCEITSIRALQLQQIKGDAHCLPPVQLIRVVGFHSGSQVRILDACGVEVVICEVDHASIVVGPACFVLLSSVKQSRVSLVCHTLFVETCEDVQIFAHVSNIESPLVVPAPSSCTRVNFFPLNVSYPGLCNQICSLNLPMQNNSLLQSTFPQETLAALRVGDNDSYVELLGNNRTGHDFPWMHPQVMFELSEPRISHKGNVDLLLLPGEACNCRLFCEGNMERSQDQTGPAVIVLDVIQTAVVKGYSCATFVLGPVLEDLHLCELRNCQLHLFVYNGSDEMGPDVLLEDCSNLEIYLYLVPQRIVRVVNCDHIVILPWILEAPGMSTLPTPEAAEECQPNMLLVYDPGEWLQDSDNAVPPPDVVNVESSLLSAPVRVLSVVGYESSPHLLDCEAALLLQSGKESNESVNSWRDATLPFQSAFPGPAELTQAFTSLRDAAILRKRGALRSVRSHLQTLILDSLYGGVIHISDFVTRIVLQNCHGPDLEIAVAASETVAVQSCSHVKMHAACFIFSASQSSFCHFALHVNQRPSFRECSFVTLSTLNLAAPDLEELLTAANVHREINLFSKPLVDRCGTVSLTPPGQGLCLDADPDGCAFLDFIEDRVMKEEQDRTCPQILRFEELHGYAKMRSSLPRDVTGMNRGTVQSGNEETLETTDREILKQVNALALASTHIVGDAIRDAACLSTKSGFVASNPDSKSMASSTESSSDEPEHPDVERYVSLGMPPKIPMLNLSSIPKPVEEAPEADEPFSRGGVMCPPTPSTSTSSEDESPTRDFPPKQKLSPRAKQIIPKLNLQPAMQIVEKSECAVRQDSNTAIGEIARSAEDEARKPKEEAATKAKEEAARKADEETRKAKEEAAQKAKDEAARRAEDEARKAKEEAIRRADEVRKAEEEAARKADEETRKGARRAQDDARQSVELSFTAILPRKELFVSLRRFSSHFDDIVERSRKLEELLASLGDERAHLASIESVLESRSD